MSQWNFRQPSLIPQIDEVPNPASDNQQAEDSNQPSENSRAHIEPPLSMRMIASHHLECNRKVVYKSLALTSLIKSRRLIASPKAQDRAFPSLLWHTASAGVRPGRCRSWVLPFSNSGRGVKLSVTSLPGSGFSPQ